MTGDRTHVFGIVGWSGSGKTTLIERLIPVLLGHGLTVSTIKHAHHGVDLDRPGKDSHRHRAAGATEVMLASSCRWVLMREHRSNTEPRLDELLGRLAPVDLVLVEGFKTAAVPKLEIWRREVGQPLLCPDDRSIVALAGDLPVEPLPVPRLALDDVAGIAALILGRCGLAQR